MYFVILAQDKYDILLMHIFQNGDIKDITSYPIPKAAHN